MSTKEKVLDIVDILTPEDMEVVYEILKRFAIAKEIPNEETVEAMMEADRIAHDPNTKKYSSFGEFIKDMEQEDNEKV